MSAGVRLLQGNRTCRGPVAEAFIAGCAHLERMTGNRKEPNYFLFADNPSGKGRYFGPSHIAINAANGIETKCHPLRRGKATDLSCKTKRL